jgi:uncharacterized membrane protein
VALVLAAVAGRLTMALFWAASAFAFIREHESIHESLLVIGTLVGITVMVVVLVASYRAIKKHMTEAKPT